MIQSFRCKQTRSLFEGGDPSRFRTFKDSAIRKLTQLDAAQTLEFLRSPPGNQLEGEHLTYAMSINTYGDKRK
jgi:proteic killer suppression protein